MAWKMLIYDTGQTLHKINDVWQQKLWEEEFWYACVYVSFGNDKQKKYPSNNSGEMVKKMLRINNTCIQILADIPVLSEIQGSLRKETYDVILNYKLDKSKMLESNLYKLCVSNEVVNCSSFSNGDHHTFEMCFIFSTIICL